MIYAHYSTNNIILQSKLCLFGYFYKRLKKEAAAKNLNRVTVGI